MKRYLRPAAFICLSLFLWSEAMAGQRPGLRELGVVIGTLPTGAHNDITDVPGVLVGHRTIIRGEAIRTGVTAILPHGGNLFLEKVAGAVEVFNGFGKLAGSRPRSCSPIPSASRGWPMPCFPICSPCPEWKKCSRSTLWWRKPMTVF